MDSEPVTMPQMGVSVTEGTLAVWHKQVGERIERDETICEISTDKIDTEIPSPAGGVVVSLLVAAGETVAVGTVLARIAPDLPVQPLAPAGVPAPTETVAQVPPASRAAVHSPVVQRIAAEHGIDLSQVRGTGRDGRISKQDVMALVEAGTATAVGSPAAPASTPETAGAVREPLSRMRRAIAEHMVRSLHTAAHCTTIIEVDFSLVEAARRLSGLSPLPYVARATARSLGRFGGLNATLEDDTITRYRDVDLGIAVSLGERGLIVPVVRAAQRLSVGELAASIRELARRARAGELSPDDVRGATFTITNPGRAGTIAATPIINQPQVAILDLEAIVRRPVVVGDGVTIRPVGNLCLSFDHRALDGVMAAEFLADLRAGLETFEE